MIAVIAGATGLVGSILIEKLLLDDEITSVVSLSRRSINSHNPKLKEVILSDFSQLKDQQDALQGDIYFCCLGTTIKVAGSKDAFRSIDYDAVISFAQVAAHHHAQSFSVISSVGANSRSKIFYSRVKGEMEEALKRMDLNALNIFQPGLLMGDRKAFRLGEMIGAHVLKALSFILPQNVTKRYATSAVTLAEKMHGVGKRVKQGPEYFLPTSI